MRDSEAIVGNRIKETALRFVQGNSDWIAGAADRCGNRPVSSCIRVIGQSERPGDVDTDLTGCVAAALHADSVTRRYKSQAPCQVRAQLVTVSAEEKAKKIGGRTLESEDWRVS